MHEAAETNIDSETEFLRFARAVLRDHVPFHFGRSGSISLDADRLFTDFNGVTLGAAPILGDPFQDVLAHYLTMQGAVRRLPASAAASLNVHATDAIKLRRALIEAVEQRLDEIAAAG